MLIYIASSFRNPLLASVFTAVVGAGYTTHDWRTGDGTAGRLFAASYDDPAAYVADLNAPAAVRKFDADLAALDTCDTLVLLLPSGNDAHCEAGYAAARNVPVIIFLAAEGFAPGLMHRFGDEFVTNIPDLLRALTAIAPVYT